MTLAIAMISEARVSQIKCTQRQKLATKANDFWEVGNKGGDDFEDYGLFQYSDTYFPCWLLIDR